MVSETGAGRHRTGPLPAAGANASQSDCDPDPHEDARTVAARRRRQIMRERLIDSLMQVCAQRQNLPFVVEDVIAHAHVSRGTFYKYFDSLDHLISFVGDRLAERFTRESIAISTNVSQPILRTAIGLYRLLEQARLDPVWGAFVSRMTLATDSNFLRTFAVEEYVKGRAAGEYRFANADAVADVTFGAIVAAIRRLSNGGRDARYVEATVHHILLSLGASTPEIEKALATAASFVLGRGVSTTA